MTDALTYSTRSIAPVAGLSALMKRALRVMAVIALAAICTASTQERASAGVSTGSMDAAAIDSIAIDWQTGYAIHGFDPVAYFTEGTAIPGDAAFEAQWRGVVWLFSNAGNRDAFVAAPAVYAPALGGHAPEMAAKGHAAPGNPYHWTIEAGRLHLFRSPRTLSAFASR